MTRQFLKVFRLARHSGIAALACATFVICISCSSVKPWQKVFLNDEEMAFGSRRIDSYEKTIETYREGASGGSSGKTGGGCGCN